MCDMCCMYTRTAPRCSRGSPFVPPSPAVHPGPAPVLPPPHPAGVMPRPEVQTGMSKNSIISTPHLQQHVASAEELLKATNPPEKTIKKHKKPPKPVEPPNTWNTSTRQSLSASTRLSTPHTGAAPRHVRSRHQRGLRGAGPVPPGAGTPCTAHVLLPGGPVLLGPGGAAGWWAGGAAVQLGPAVVAPATAAAGHSAAGAVAAAAVAPSVTAAAV